MTSKITKNTSFSTANDLETKTKNTRKAASASTATPQSDTATCLENSQNRPIIVFTGGGTGGHVYPNLALVPEFEKEVFAPCTSAARATLSKENLRATQA